MFNFLTDWKISWKQSASFSFCNSISHKNREIEFCQIFAVQQFYMKKRGNLSIIKALSNLVSSSFLQPIALSFLLPLIKARNIKVSVPSLCQEMLQDCHLAKKRRNLESVQAPLPTSSWKIVSFLRVTFWANLVWDSRSQCKLLTEVVLALLLKLWALLKMPLTRRLTTLQSET